jgi:hypothetical protein
MTRIYSFLALLLLSYSALCQDIPIQYAETITEDRLKKHLAYLASDELEGRETGMKGQFLAAEYIAAQFESFGLDKVVPTKNGNSYFQHFYVYRKDKRQRLAIEDRTLPKGYDSLATMNVLGFLEGTDKKDEIVILTAHYDHIGISSNGEINNGADDDGSGTAAIIEMAAAFSKAKSAGHGPRRSILFMLVTGEEKGLLGSRYFTDYDPVIPLENIICNLNIDMIGRQDDRHDTDQYIYLIGSDKISTELDLICREQNQKYLNFDLDYTYNDEKDPNRFYYRSDHYNFAKKGIPVAFFFTGVHEDYHRPGDDIEKIHFPKYSKISRYIFLVASEISNRTNTLKRDVISK